MVVSCLAYYFIEKYCIFWFIYIVLYSQRIFYVHTTKLLTLKTLFANIYKLLLFQCISSLLWVWNILLFRSWKLLLCHQVLSTNIKRYCYCRGKLIVIVFSGLHFYFHIKCLCSWEFLYCKASVYIHITCYIYIYIYIYKKALLKYKFH